MRKISAVIFLTALAAMAGCTTQSTRHAIDGFTRADEVRTAAVKNLRDGLAQAIFTNAVARLKAGGDVEEVVRDAMQNRDRLEFLLDQIQRADEVELVTVYAKLINDQGILNLLLGDAKQRVDRVEKTVINRLAGDAGQNIFEKAVSDNGN